ncbi:MAG: enoyl-CoA hydratase/isomerase family protein [Alphaproteobacteria bacterium]
MSLPEYQTLQIVDRNDGETELWLNRPDKHNAFDDVMIAELTSAFKTLGERAETRLVTLRAHGQSFCAGADLGWMKRMAAYTDEENIADALKLADMLEAVNTCPKPVVARVDGPCFGGGVGLVAACDVVVASARAAFTLSEVKLGLIPATIAPYVIAKIGQQAARRYMLTAERIPAQTAERIGLIDEMGEAADAHFAGIRRALLKGSPEAQGATKALIDAVSNRPIDQAVKQDTAERIAAARASTDGREGLTAFFERRKPAWLTEET